MVPDRRWGLVPIYRSNTKGGSKTTRRGCRWSTGDANPINIFLLNFLKTAMKSGKIWPMERAPNWLQRSLPPVSRASHLPNSSIQIGLVIAKRVYRKLTETQDVTNNVIRYRVTNKDTLHALHYRTMLRLKDSVWTRAFITAVYCA